MLLLMIFSGHSYAQTKPRKFGVGIRYGTYQDTSSFSDAEDNRRYISSDSDGVNSKRSLTFPIFIQFDEDLINKWSFIYTFLDFRSLSKKDMPPKLKDGLTYDNLINENTVNNNTQNFYIRSDQTYISEFIGQYPHHSQSINLQNNATLSADFDLDTVSIGKLIGIFIPLKNSHRLFTLGLGLGISITNGNYSINTCEPFRVMGELESEALLFNRNDHRKGICENKKQLYDQNILNFGFGGHATAKLYSYVSSDWEINVFEVDGHASIPFIFENDDEILHPIFGTSNFNFISYIHHIN